MSKLLINNWKKDERTKEKKGEKGVNRRRRITGSRTRG